MNCGCIKHLGCYAPNEMINFGLLAPYSGEYFFEIFSNTGFSTMIVNFSATETIQIPFTFNENSTTLIKVRFDLTFAAGGCFYLTSSDGACSFEVTGIVPSC